MRGRLLVTLLGALPGVGCGREHTAELVDGGTRSLAPPRASGEDLGPPHPVVAVALPEGSVPDVVVDEADRIHVAWLTNSSNIVYGQFRKDGEPSKHPVRVNHEFGAATGGGFRGPDLDLGEGGRAHVAWYPNREMEDRELAPGVHYAYADPDATFTDARSLNQRPSDNFSLAASEHGRVVVMWTAEDLFVQRSEDGGETWGEPANAGLDVLPCECCATRLYLGPEDTSFALYRERAGDMRDMHVLAGIATEAPVRHRLATEPWKVSLCPMSGSYLYPAEGGVVAAWRTIDAIEFTRLDEAGNPSWPVRRVDDEGAGKRYPVIVVAADGTLLVAYKRATTLVWRLYEPDGTPRSETGSSETENPGRAAGGATSDGTFVLFG